MTVRGEMCIFDLERTSPFKIWHLQSACGPFRPLQICQASLCLASTYILYD